MAHRPALGLALAVLLTACGGPQEKPDSKGPEASSDKPLGLSCYFPEIPDRDGPVVLFTAGVGSEATDIVVSHYIDGMFQNEERYGPLDVVERGDWPLAVYTGGHLEIEITNRVEPGTAIHQFDALYRNTIRDDGREPMACYFFTQED